MAILRPIGAESDSAPQTPRTPKQKVKKATRAKAARASEAQTAINSLEWSVDSLLEELDDSNINVYQAKAIMKKYQRLRPDIVKTLVSSVDLMNKIPPYEDEMDGDAYLGF